MNTTKTTAKDFFLYLGIIIGLYVSAISFLILVFQMINKLFPLVGEYYYPGQYDSPIRSTVAILIIFFPTFIYLSYITNKDLIANPDKKELWIRRWMIFFTLFLTGITIAVDLAVLIYRFLGAEDLTVRFFLKIFFVLAVAVTIFRSSLYDLKRSAFEFSTIMKIRAGAVSIVILIALIYGVVLIGSPMAQRARTLDTQRTNDLMSIQNQIVYSQWQNKGTVPNNLTELNDPISGFILPIDPETKQNYEYKKLTKNSFELCATFKTENIASSTLNGKTQARLYPYEMAGENWLHPMGRTCFTRTIDESLYPIKKAVNY